MSSWTLILLTAQRLISVWMPFKCKELCSRRRIIIAWSVISLPEDDHIWIPFAVAVISLLLFGANMHFFFTLDLQVIVPEGGNITDASVTCYVRDQFAPFFIESSALPLNPTEHQFTVVVSGSGSGRIPDLVSYQYVSSLFAVACPDVNQRSCSSSIW